MKKIFTLFLLLVFTFSFANYSANTKLACPTAAISYPGSPFCSNISTPQTVAMTGTDNYTGGTFSSMPGLVINAATGAITPSLSTPGTYAVSYTIPADGGCPGFLATTTIIITALPTVTINYPGTPYCKSQTAPQPVVISGTGAYTGGTYMSNVGLSINAVTGDITPSTSVAGTYTVTYTAPVSGGCMAIPATATVTIYDAPTATIAFNQTICPGSSTTINFTGTPNATVSYNINGGPNQSIILNSSGNATLSTGPLTTTTTYNLTSVTSFCLSPVSGSVTITVIPSPTIFGSPSACMGNMIQFTGSGIPAASNPWTSSNMAVATVNSTGLVTTMSPGITTITYKNINGCTAMQTLVVHNLPIITANSSLQTICSGTNTNIALTSTIPGTTYSWNVVQAGVTGGSADSGNSINQVLFTTGNNIGQAVYTITPTANGCNGSPITVTVQVNPIPTVIPNTYGETINSGETTNITLSSNIASTTFNWTVSQSNVTGAAAGSGNTISQQLYTINSNQNGYITYTITPSFNGCVGQSEIVQTTINSNLSANSFDSQNFIVSPNPVTDILTIKNDQTINRVTAFNQLGQVVLQKEYNTNEVQLDFSGLETGIYFISMDSDKKQSTFKIVKN